MCSDVGLQCWPNKRLLWQDLPPIPYARSSQQQTFSTVHFDECLDCDKTNVGPLFAKIAARTRRRSGLISKIARACEDILFVDHQNPCDVVQGIEREFEQGDVCKLKDPPKEPECVTVTTDLGLNSFEAQRNGKFFDFDFHSKMRIYTQGFTASARGIPLAKQGMVFGVTSQTKC